MTVAIYFCEPAYAYSPYIAELWNTLSSLAYCLAGGAYLVELWKVRNFFPPGTIWKFILLGVSIIAIGIGSALLHGTQTWWGELADELSMLAGALSFLFCQEDLHPLTSGSRRFWFYGTACASVAVVTAMYLIIFIHGIFATLFAAMVGLSITIFSTSPLHSALAAAKFKLRVGKRLAESVYGPRFMLGTVLAVVGFATWTVDQTCVRMQWRDTPLGWLYIFHSAWHLLTAAGAWVFLNLILQVRVNMKSSPFERSKSGSFVPRNFKD